MKWDKDTEAHSLKTLRGIMNIPNTSEESDGTSSSDGDRGCRKRSYSEGSGKIRSMRIYAGQFMPNDFNNLRSKWGYNS